MTPTPLLYLLIHPDIGASRANKLFASSVSQLPGVNFVDLYAQYPDFFIDGAAERRRIDNTDTIVVQMPVYWYAGPSLFKEWIDRTFIPGWAHGEAGTALTGKSLLLSVTTGSPQSEWVRTSTHRATAEDYLRPYQQMAQFCGMNWLEPTVFYEARSSNPIPLEVHAKLLRQRITGLVDDITTRHRKLEFAEKSLTLPAADEREFHGE